MHQTIWIDIDIIVNSIASCRCCLCGLMSVMWRAQNALLGESASSCDFLYFRIFSGESLNSPYFGCENMRQIDQK